MGGVGRRSRVAEQAPEVVVFVGEGEGDEKWGLYQRQGLGFVRKGVDTPPGKKRDRVRDREMEREGKGRKNVRFEDGRGYGRGNGYEGKGGYNGDRGYEGRGPGARRTVEPSRQMEKRVERRRTEEMKRDNRKCMGWRGVTTLVFTAILIGGAISGGLVLALVKKPDAPVYVLSFGP